MIVRHLGQLAHENTFLKALLVSECLKLSCVIRREWSIARTAMAKVKGDARATELRMEVRDAASHWFNRRA